MSTGGGKLDLGESSLDGAAREILEETGLPAAALRMHPRAISVSDAIVPRRFLSSLHEGDGDLLYHYVIAQFFAWVDDAWVERVRPGDDAGDARWFEISEIRAMPEELGSKPQEMANLIELCQGMHAAGLLTAPHPPANMNDEERRRCDESRAQAVHHPTAAADLPWLKMQTAPVEGVELA